MGNKKTGLSLQLLENDAYLVHSQGVIDIVCAKIQMINAQLSIELNRNVMIQCTSRIKSVDSTRAKLKKKGLKENYTEALESINDLIGIRVVCSFMDDIYYMVNHLKEQKDLKILKIKDYMKKPKASGYRSLHVIMEVPVYIDGQTQQRKVEIQFRTAAMDFWSGLDHQLCYKKGKKEADLIGKELKDCSMTVFQLDEEMIKLRKRIEAI